MEEARFYEMTGYSVWPYTNEHSRESFHVLERSRQFFYAFKNGRPYHREEKHLDFDEIIDSLLVKARVCPAFDEASLLVPVPRSGMSERSFLPGAEMYPCRLLAQRLAGAISRGHRAVELFTRVSPLPPSSLAGRRPSLAEHMNSLSLNMQGVGAQPIVLIDDLLTKGTQSMACLVKLRRAGFTPRISGFYVSQTVHRGPSILQQQPYLLHRIEYWSGNDYPRRFESSAWRDCPNQGFSGRDNGGSA